jgi:ribosome maturation factor RimP
MLTGREKKVLEALEPAAEANGVEIVTVEIMGSKKAPTIRVFIDTPSGVGFDELAAAQVWIDQIIDELDPFPGAYTMEVSSPGIDRPLRTPEHFQRFIGERAVVKTNGPVEGRSNFTGNIVSATDETVCIDCDGTTYDIPFAQMKRANLKGTVSF